MKRLTTAEREARAAHFNEHPECWLCKWLRRKQWKKTELHHIAGRGKQHETRENYAALCADCHSTLQSRNGAELICLWLKSVYDQLYYNPETICELRGRSVNCWTHHDVEQCGNVLRLLMEVIR
jgi:hypothetical protein